jgi:hypothetical protein
MRRILERSGTAEHLAPPTAISRHLKVLEAVDWMQARKRTWEGRMDGLDAHLRRKGEQHE